MMLPKPGQSRLQGEAHCQQAAVGRKQRFIETVIPARLQQNLLALLMLVLWMFVHRKVLLSLVTTDVKRQF